MLNIGTHHVNTNGSRKAICISNTRRRYKTNILWQKAHNTSAITILGGLNYSVAVDNEGGGGVRSEARGGGEGGGVVTQATGHHRSYWFVVSLVLQHPSLSYTPTSASSSLCLPRVPPAHVGTYGAYVNVRMGVWITMCWLYVCVGVRILCTYAFSTEFSLYCVTDTKFFILCEYSLGQLVGFCLKFLIYLFQLYNNT